MSYLPISNTVPQYAASGSTQASGYYLKAYQAGTTTPLSMATDKAGGTTLAKCKLNSQGYPLSIPSDDTSVFIPHFNQDYKLALYPTEADADANTFANADWVVDNLGTDTTAAQYASTVAVMKTLGLSIGDVVETGGYTTAGDGGGAKYVIVAGGTGTDDAGSYHDLDNGNQAFIVPEGSSFNGLQFGMVSDYVEATGAGTDNSSAFTALMTGCNREGLAATVPKGNYKFTVQQTIKHDVKVDFNGSTVALIHTGSDNDSVFQMGDNTTLENIDRLLYTSTSVSAYTTLGLIKIGEFYAFTGGSPNAGDNSLDATYHRVDNVTIRNVHGFAALLATESDRSFNATIYNVSGNDNLRVDNISLNGLCADSTKVELASVYREETGYDTTIREGGQNVVLDNITGVSLRAHPENGVVVFQGWSNVDCSNVWGSDCGQLLSISTNGTSSNLNSDRLDKSTINVNVRNVLGVDCNKLSTDTFSKALGALNIRAFGPDLQTEQRFICSVENFYATCTTATANERITYGIVVNDNSATNTPNDVKRISIENFEVTGFSIGVFSDTGGEQVAFKKGFIHRNRGNGMFLLGNYDTVENCKVLLNNQDASTDTNGSAGFGISVRSPVCVIRDTIVGDNTVAAGSETQLNAIKIDANDVKCEIQNCLIANYKTGYSDIYLDSGKTGAEIEIDHRTRGEQRSIVSSFDKSPTNAKVRASITGGTGASTYAFNCTTSRISTGRYRVTFSPAMDNTDYQIFAMATGGTGAARFVDWSSKSTSSVDIYTKDAAGTVQDTNVDVIVFGDLSDVL